MNHLVETSSINYPIAVSWIHKDSPPTSILKRGSRIILVCRSTGICRYDGTCMSVQSGNVFVVDASVPLQLEGTGNLKAACIYFDSRKLKMHRWPTVQLAGYHELFINGLHGNKGAYHIPILALDETSLRNCIALTEEMEKCSSERFPCWEMLADIHFRHLVLSLSRAYDGHLRPHDEARLRVAKAMEYIDNHYLEAMDLDKLAKLVGMSPRTFYRLFKRATGHPPLAYIILRRVQHSSELLRNTDQLITQVAYDSGFSDSNYFTREFRRIIGETPSSYRSRWSN